MLRPALRDYAGPSFFDLNLLHGEAIRSFSEEWWRWGESNPRPVREDEKRLRSQFRLITAYE